MISVNKRPAWKALTAHQRKIKSLHLRKLFDTDPKRGQRMTVEAAGLLLDYSKNRIVEVKGFIGFAVGRTNFWEPLVNYRAKNITREAAVSEIARRYRQFADIFEGAD